MSKLALLVLVVLLCPLTPMIAVAAVHNLVAPISQGAAQAWCFAAWLVQCVGLVVVSARQTRTK